MSWGGDSRIAINARTGRNQYGCRLVPEPDVYAFGSSTASSISERGFEAAERMRQRIGLRLESTEAPTVYADEVEGVRLRLRQLCSLSADVDIVLAASGTDAHLIASQVFPNPNSGRPFIVATGLQESGSGVMAALTGRHFSSRSTYDHAVPKGELLSGATDCEVATVPVRHADGSPRDLAEIDNEVEKLVRSQADSGRPVLLIAIDVSKTGMLAPSVACMQTVQRVYGDNVQVLVDACQFRIGPQTLQTYLDSQFVVAVTGSKFLVGPSFSAALLVPARVAAQWSRRPVTRALSAYSSQHDWPSNWVARRDLSEQLNWGLVLRWQAALSGLEAFYQVPTEHAARVIREFAAALPQAVEPFARVRMLATPAPARGLFDENESWDALSTIFPFYLCHTDGHAVQPLSHKALQMVHQLLQTDASNWLPETRDDRIRALASLRCMVGQPVICGTAPSEPLSALRLCLGADQIAWAARQPKSRIAALLGQVIMIFEKAQLLAAALPSSSV